MTVSRFKIAKKDIIGFFDKQPKRIFMHSEIASLLSEHREFWRLPVNMSADGFLDLLIKHTPMQKIKFDFPNRPELRYSWGDVPTFEVLSSLRKDGYFSHYTAVYLHGLTEQIPKVIYLNKEQPRKGPAPSLPTQESLDQAFKRQPRKSKNIADFKGYRVCMINSMGQGNKGIKEMPAPDGYLVPVTDIERTLLDITVRPAYSGGVAEVLKAYKAAAGLASSNRLAALLKGMGYLYPYHQAIGFYMEKSGGYSEAAIKLFLDQRKDFDFYLTHGIEDKEYIEKWRLFVPKGF